MKLKSFKRFIIAIFSTIILEIIMKSNIYAASNGAVNKYYVTVSPNANGLLNLVYNLEIKVESDNLNEIQIKLPTNSYLVQNKDSKISSITPDETGDYTTIKLSRSYKSGDTLNLNFSLLQAHVYKKSNNSCIYKVTFGELKDFSMDKIKVQWIKKNVTFKGLGVENDKYLIWERKYSNLRKFNVSVRYDQSIFNLTDNGQIYYGIKEYVSEYGLIALAAIIIIFEILLNIIKRKNRWG